MSSVGSSPAEANMTASPGRIKGDYDVVFLVSRARARVRVRAWARVTVWVRVRMTLRMRVSVRVRVWVRIIVRAQWGPLPLSRI